MAKEEEQNEKGMSWLLGIARRAMATASRTHTRKFRAVYRNVEDLQ